MGVKDPNDARIVRRLIAETFDALLRHDIALSELIMTPPEHMRNCEIHDLLRRAPKLDYAGTKKILREARVDALTQLKDLSLKDKQAIIAHLPPRAKP